jgi:hypothetical protein
MDSGLVLRTPRNDEERGLSLIAFRGDDGWRRRAQRVSSVAPLAADRGCGCALEPIS